MPSEKKIDRILKYAQLFLYLSFLFLWFKDNFPALRGLEISYVFPLVPLLIVTGVRICLYFKGKKVRIKKKPSSGFLLIMAVVALAVLFRIPFLAYYQGMNDGDDGLIIIQAKHISEGKRPSVYNYGVIYEGSAMMHVYALLFRGFGYSVFLMRLTALLFFSAFIILQFYFLKDIFSKGPALAVSLFYALPIGHTVITSLNLSGDFPYILFFGSLILFVTYLIVFKNKIRLLPFLGFLLGFSFWIHQMTVSFILASVVLIILKFRFRLKPYFKLIAYALVGGFPIVLSEIFTRFSLIRFLMSGGSSGLITWNKIKRGFMTSTYLFFRQDSLLGSVLIAVVFLSALGFLIVWMRKKKFIPLVLYLVFFACFLVVFFFSKFSDNPVLSVRYLYPLYFVLPLFLFSFMMLFRKKTIGAGLAACFLIVLFSFHNLRDYAKDISLVKNAHVTLKKTISAIHDTGKKYWVGNYWDSFVVTPLSGEKIIAYAYMYYDHYLPHMLMYYNSGRETANYLFFKEEGFYALGYREMLPDLRENIERKMENAGRLVRLLDTLRIKHRTKIIDDNLLVYDIREEVLPVVLGEPVPKKFPDLEIKKAEAQNGYLKLEFENKQVFRFSDFRIHIEIPGYSSLKRGFSPTRKELSFRIPYPENERFIIRHLIDYKGIPISFTLKEKEFAPVIPDIEEKRPQTLLLSGFGPMIPFGGKERRICEKETTIELNPSGKNVCKVRLAVTSPFDFDHPFWYGRYEQRLTVKAGEKVIQETDLRHGENTVTFSIGADSLNKASHILTLSFRYHLPFDFAPMWKTSAFLDDISLE